MLSYPCDPKTEARNFQLDNICLPSEKAISCISGAGAGSGWQFSFHFPPRSQWRRRACFPFWSLSECRGNFCTLFDYHRMRKILGHISEVSKPHISVLFDRLETILVVCLPNFGMFIEPLVFAIPLDPLCSPVLSSHTAPEEDAGLIWVTSGNSFGIWNFDVNATRKCKN